jgi:hypothetical protein
MGLKGAGKTKQLIHLVNENVNKADGVIVVLEHGPKLTYDINHGARLIDTVPYEIKSYQVLRGFITGLYAGNYDLNQVFIDSLFKISGSGDMLECERFLGWCERFGEVNGIDFTITVSARVEDATEGMKKYLTQVSGFAC